MRNFQKLILSLVALSILSCGKSSSSSPAAASTNKIIFVTDIAIDGNIGTIGDADTSCITNAILKLLANPANYKAMIVGTDRTACTTDMCSGAGSGEHADWVLKANTTYIRTDATVIGTTDVNALLPIPLINSIDPTKTDVWTGIEYRNSMIGLPASRWVNATSNCNNWTINAGNVAGETGNPSVSNNTSIDAGNPVCSGLKNLYCVEQ